MWEDKATMDWKSLAKGLIDKVFDKKADTIADAVVKKTKTLIDRFRIDLGLAFEKYLEKTYDKYSTAKTLLYKDRPRPISDFFVVPTLKNGQEDRIDANGINDIIGKQHFFIVQGTGGIGKSTLMKHLFLSALEECELIPIFFELKDINDQTDDYILVDILFKELGIFGSQLTREAIEYALKQGLFLFLLDGYDEIKSEKAPVFLKRMNLFCDGYSKNYVIISARPISNFVEFKRFVVLTTCGFSKDQALSLIDKLDYEKTAKQRFIVALEDKLYENHETFATNPLLLLMMFLTYDDYAEIPENMHIFYERAFVTLFMLHDPTKEGYKRELRSKLQYYSFRTVFSHFCCISYYNNELEFTFDRLMSILKRVKNDLAEAGIDFSPEEYINDLVNAVCMLYREGFEYRFVHRSFQEYFTAVYLKGQLDDVMKKRGLAIIKNDTVRVLRDSTFIMLREMARDKFDKNILLPLLKEIEYSFKGDDNYFSYFKSLTPKIIGSRTDLLQFTYGSISLFVFCMSNTNEVGKFIDDLHINDEIRAYLVEKRQFRDFVSVDLDVNDLISDKELYLLIKKSLIGRRIAYLSTLREQLEQKFAAVVNDYDFFTV